MIIDFFIIIATQILAGFGNVIYALTTGFGVIPQQVQDGFAWLLGNLRYFRGVVPIDDIFAAFGFVVGMFVIIYSIRLIQWIWAHVPFLGKFSKLPRMSK